MSAAFRNEAPLKEGLCAHLVSKHIIQIHAIEPSVFEFSSHEE